MPLEASRRILQAALFAAEKHSRQRRKGKDGAPYVNHLIEVAQMVSMALTEPDTNLVIADCENQSGVCLGSTHRKVLCNGGSWARARRPIASS